MVLYDYLETWKDTLYELYLLSSISTVMLIALGYLCLQVDHCILKFANLSDLIKNRPSLNN